VIRTPKLVVEILSKSTRHIDRREKATRVIVHRRAEEWHPMLYSAMDARVEFRSIGLHMSLAQIYEGTLAG
jgi:hypothetical protein